jgi:hypothetical protein
MVGTLGPPTPAKKKLWHFDMLHGLRKKILKILSYIRWKNRICGLRLTREFWDTDIESPISPLTFLLSPSKASIISIDSETAILVYEEFQTKL